MPSELGPDNAYWNFGYLVLREDAKRPRDHETADCGTTGPIDCGTKGLPAGVSRGSHRSRFQLPLIRRGTAIKQTTEHTDHTEIPRIRFLSHSECSGSSVVPDQCIPSLSKPSQGKPSHASPRLRISLCHRLGNPVPLVRGVCRSHAATSRCARCSGHRPEPANLCPARTGYRFCRKGLSRFARGSGRRRDRSNPRCPRAPAD